MNTKKFPLVCTCGRCRGDIPEVPREPTKPHECPVSCLIVQGPQLHSCGPCPACTILCMPTKILRDQENYRTRFGERIASLFDCLKEKLMR